MLTQCSKWLFLHYNDTLPPGCPHKTLISYNSCKYSTLKFDNKEPHKPISAQRLYDIPQCCMILFDTSYQQEAFMAVLKMDED